METASIVASSIFPKDVALRIGIMFLISMLILCTAINDNYIYIGIENGLFVQPQKTAVKRRHFEIFSKITLLFRVTLTQYSKNVRNHFAFRINHEHFKGSFLLYSLYLFATINCSTLEKNPPPIFLCFPSSIYSGLRYAILPFFE
jgi:hypothetical protein